MKGLLTLLKRALIFGHRWLGVALSVILLLWFASGIVMLYHRFPSVRAQDRLQRLPVIEPARINLSAAEAFSALGSSDAPAHVLLTSFDGRPVYLSGGTMIYADDGREHRDVDDAMIDRAAAVWSGRPLDEATKTAVEDVDQWTLSSELRNLRPMYRSSWPDGQQVYVDGTTADVVQYTTTASRFWAYLGAIPHWFYFTPLRVQQRTWFSLVVWSSLVGTVTMVIGMAIAVWMSLAATSLSTRGRPDSYRLSRVETLAHHCGPGIWSDRNDLGVQRSPDDGAVSGHGTAGCADSPCRD